MRKKYIALTAVLLAWCAAAESVCVNGVCYPDEESARAAGALLTDAPHLPDSMPGMAAKHVGTLSPSDLSVTTNVPVQTDLKNLLHEVDASPDEVKDPPKMRISRRLAMGYMGPEEFKKFLLEDSAGNVKSDAAETPASGGKSSLADKLGSASVVMAFVLVFFGGLLMNLTPCVLPLIPVSLALVGRGAARGTAYGLGMTLSYGALGLAAAFGGLAFGTIQSSPWFNLVVAAVFIFLALATSEVFFIDFSRFRPRPKSGGAVTGKGGLLGAFVLGAGTAVLAGACVAPILLATLLLTADWFAAGRVWAVALPFVLGAGMGLPWPFVTAGLSVLPKPGAWMRWVNRAFAILLFGMAAWYGWLAWEGFAARRASVKDTAPSANDVTGEGVVVSPERPRLVILGAPWCKNCTAMEQTTLKEPSVVETLSNFDVSHISINDFHDLRKYPELDGLKIMGVPAYVVFEAKPVEKKQVEKK